MEKVFLNKNNVLDSEGIYAMRFYTLGVPHDVVIDDYLPLKDGKTMFSNPGTDGSIWTAILEKAFAKYHGNYSHIVGGWPGEAVRTLTGAPYETIKHKQISVDDLWERLSLYDGSNAILMAGSADGSDKDTNAEGVVLGHAYTVLGVKKLSNGVRLVKLRNPWGTDSYHGDWSDKSSLWTPELRKEAGAVDANDGIVHMTVEYFQANFESTDFIEDASKMFAGYYLKLNDNAQTDPTNGIFCKKAGC